MSSLVPIPLMFFFLLSIPPISNFIPSHTLPRLCLWPSPFHAPLHLHMFHLSSPLHMNTVALTSHPPFLSSLHPTISFRPMSFPPSSSPNPGLLQLPPPPLTLPNQPKPNQPIQPHPPPTPTQINTTDHTRLATRVQRRAHKKPRNPQILSKTSIPASA